MSANVGPGTGPERKPSSLWGPVATQANASETVEPGRLGELKRFTLWETRTVSGMLGRAIACLQTAKHVAVMACNELPCTRGVVHG